MQFVLHITNNVLLICFSILWKQHLLNSSPLNGISFLLQKYNSLILFFCLIMATICNDSNDIMVNPCFLRWLFFFAFTAVSFTRISYVNLWLPILFILLKIILELLPLFIAKLSQNPTLLSDSTFYFYSSPISYCHNILATWNCK